MGERRIGVYLGRPKQRGFYHTTSRMPRDQQQMGGRQELRLGDRYYTAPDTLFMFSQQNRPTVSAMRRPSDREKGTYAPPVTGSSTVARSLGVPDLGGLL